MVPSAYPGSVTPVGQAGRYDKIVPGWSSLLTVILIASGIFMMLLSAIGVDVGYISQQV